CWSAGSGGVDSGARPNRFATVDDRRAARPIVARLDRRAVRILNSDRLGQHGVPVERAAAIFGVAKRRMCADRMAAAAVEQ
ncbi:MAG: hypothetical protein ABR591_12190, partial [Candidatus Velthaea sp.]